MSETDGTLILETQFPTVSPPSNATPYPSESSSTEGIPCEWLGYHPTDVFPCSAWEETASFNDDFFSEKSDSGGGVTIGFIIFGVFAATIILIGVAVGLSKGNGGRRHDGGRAAPTTTADRHHHVAHAVAMDGHHHVAHAVAMNHHAHAVAVAMGHAANDTTTSQTTSFGGGFSGGGDCGGGGGGAACGGGDC